MAGVDAGSALGLRGRLQDPAGVFRKLIQNLTVREYCLYRAICLELDGLAEEIDLEGRRGGDFLCLATAMRDRRLLVEWLRDLHFPPSSHYGTSGITEEVEDLLLAGSDSEDGRESGADSGPEG